MEGHPIRPPQALLDFIKGWEGCKLVAYQDSVGVWTIGYGHTVNVHEGDTCTQEQADKWIADDVDERWHAIDQFIRATLAEHEMAAIVSLAFNVGVSAVAKSTLLSRVNNGDFGSAADEFLRWNRAGGKIVPGLTKRRQAERAMFLNADYSGRP